MKKIIKFFKNLRPEFMVALFFFLIILSYTTYTFISDIFFDKNKPVIVSSKDGVNKPRSITEAITAERPLIVSTDERKEIFNSMIKEMPELKGVELTAEVENPAVWIYMGSDGSRRDSLASEYCKWLHNKGIMASSVTILDSAARASGKLVEIGESGCM